MSAFSARRSVASTGSAAPSARGVALEAMTRIDGGAYANLVVPTLLDRAGLATRDAGFVTELVYGATRMRRACDWLIERHLAPGRQLDADVRALLRLGAYQLAFLGTPPHAGVGETVEVAPVKVRGLINAVLRKVAADVARGPVAWPDPPTALSYPDWVVRRLARDLGTATAEQALRTMNEAPEVTVRADGYVQDPASQWVAEAVAAGPGDRVADLWAGPGGKATLLGHTAAVVAALDLRPHRAGLVRTNARRLGITVVHALVADARRPPLRPVGFDHVLLDAPCSGLGVLRRRPDARWRIEEADVDQLARLQRQLLDAAAALLRPRATLTYSVCTLTRAETEDIDDWLAEAHPGLAPLEPPGPPWSPVGRGARLLPQAVGTDGMYLLQLRRPA